MVETSSDHDRTSNRRSDSRQWSPFRRPLLTWSLFVLATLGLLAIFAELAEDIASKQNFAWDAPLMQAIHQLVNPGLTAVMDAVTEFGESIAIVIVVGLVLWFWWRKQLIDAVTLFACFAGGMALSNLFKLVLARPRPTLFPPLIVESGYSFPSGHSIAAVALYGLLAILLWRRQQHGWAIFFALWIPLIDLSRIYLSVHYPSDVLGGFALGSLWVLIVFAARAAYEHRLQIRRTL